MPASASFVAQRLRLHYVSWGDTAKPTLILIHGGRDHCRAWDWVAAALAADWHIIAPDLRGHGDSAWSDAGSYTMAGFLYDLAQLVHQQACGPVTLIGHSLGGNIATRFTGLYPELVARLVCIEGLGPSPKLEAELAATPIETRLRGWVDEQRQLAARLPRRYASLSDAIARMSAANTHLSRAQATHLTIHGVRRNEDGSYSWKFDPYIRSLPPVDSTRAEIRHLWGRIACPTLLVYGAQSWASNPAADGRAAHFTQARVVSVPHAGHWVHHDQLDAFLAAVRPFVMAG